MLEQKYKDIWNKCNKVNVYLLVFNTLYSIYLMHISFPPGLCVGLLSLICLSKELKIGEYEYTNEMLENENKELKKELNVK